MHLRYPRHHIRRICSGSCRRSIRRRCGRGWWGVRRSRIRGIFRRICHRGDRWRYRLVCGTLLNRLGFVNVFFERGGEVSGGDLRMMTRHDALVVFVIVGKYVLLLL